MFEKLFGTQNAAPKAANDNSAASAETAGEAFNPETYFEEAVRTLLAKTDFDSSNEAEVTQLISRLKRSFETHATSDGTEELSDAGKDTIDAFVGKFLVPAISAMEKPGVSHVILNEETGMVHGTATSETEARGNTRTASEEEHPN